MNVRRGLWLLTTGLLLLPLVAAWLAIDSSPRVERTAAVTPGDIERAMMILRAHDPRRQRAGVMRVVVAEQRDINLLLQHTLGRYPGLAAEVALDARQAVVRASLPLNVGPLGRWLNLEAAFTPGNGPPAITRLRLGSLPLPAWLAEPLAGWALERRGLSFDRRLLHDVVRRTEFRSGRVIVFYAWREDSLGRILAALVPLPDQERLRAYSDRLVEVTNDGNLNLVVSLDRLLPPLFALARQRTAAGGDAAGENRAALLTLAFFANRRGLGAIVPAARTWARPRPLIVTLGGRPDLSLHFLVSASIAAQADTPLADAVGVYKEVADSRHGSGFSFVDLAADRAGTRFGELAIRAPLRVQELIAGSLVEADLLPDVSDLPEHLSASDFKQQFGAVGSPAYERMMSDIESRLSRAAALR
jgi:hypothetical protein